MVGTPNLIETDAEVGSTVGQYVYTIPVTLSTLSDAAQFTITPAHRGRLKALDFYTHLPATTTSKQSVLTPSIGGVNCTGGVVTLTRLPWALWTSPCRVGIAPTGCAMRTSASASACGKTRTGKRICTESVLTLRWAGWMCMPNSQRVWRPRRPGRRHG